MNDEIVSSDASLLSVDYYRQKVIEFQIVLNNLDGTFTQLISAQALAYEVGDENMIAEADSLVYQLTDKLGSFRTVAEGIQLASKGINAVGVQFPTVEVPGGLGVVPLVPLAAAAAVIAAAVALTVWAKGFWTTVSDFARRYQTIAAIQALPPEDQANALALLQQTDAQAETARAAADGSPLSSLANIGKWIVLGGLLFVGYIALKRSKD